MQPALKEIDLWIDKGDQVRAFNGANDAIGTLVLQFETAVRLEEVLKEYATYFEVIINL